MTSFNGSPLPSSQWNGRETLINEPNNSFHKLIVEFLARVDFDALCDLASTLRSGVECHVSEQFTFGSENVIREVVFKDGMVWIARLCIRNVQPAVVRSEAVTMQYVKKHTTLPVPLVFGYNDSCDNAVGNPYIFMEAMHGRCHSVEHGGLMLDIPQDKKRFVCQQLADYFLQLNSLRFPALGALDMDPEGNLFLTDIMRVHDNFPRSKEAPQYYRFIALAHLRRFLDKSESLFFASWLELSLAKQMGKSTMVDYPLAHPDFTARNILFDDNFRIIGIVDWSYAHTVPTELFCTVPAGGFLGPDRSLDDIPPEWKGKIEARIAIQKSFREEFLIALRELEISSETKTKLGPLFEDIRTTQALMFNDYYGSWISELYELAFRKPARGEDVRTLREWLLQQDLDLLLDKEEKEAYSLREESVSRAQV